ncbi:MAG: primosomal protein N' [Defluviitaleaceae bacterium]|nr:primosomal protein N' [Defluviitaleaceae bacterium]
MSTYALVCVDHTHSEVDRLFHYKSVIELQIGMRVRVPFGMGSGSRIGYVMGFSDTLPDDISVEKIKEISSICDDFSVLTSETLALSFWMKDKYYTTLANCVRAITPSSKADGRFPSTRNRLSACSATPADITLTAEQQEAITAIKETNIPILLHGVTGSGKTEVYLHAIADILSTGKQAIVLVPEIALTPQMVGLFSARFGEAVAVTHSRLTSGERFRIWKRALDAEISLVIGPRSAVFAPFPNLGLIVIDEEHEQSYHSETSPKYDAREVAIKRAELSNAKVVLGSATPSLESYHKTDYKLIKLRERINKTLPDICVIDMRKEMARGNAAIFGREFREALQETLDAGQQAILFLNRRGYSSFVSCRWCGHVMTCDSCRVNHTYHSDKNRLLCHYCGKATNMPQTCPACGSKHIRRYGTGTQKVEEEVAELFPDAKVLRMDTDTTRGKFGHAKILDAFRAGEAQILIGTQMVAKGLDFPRVTFVGVVAADMSLHTGDFRSGEYTFQLLTQVSGRAGRATDVQDVLGRVFIQTYNPEHYAIALAEKGDYDAFFEHEIGLRKAMNYPPFSHVFSVMFTGAGEREVISALQKLSAIMEYCNERDGRGRFELIGISPAFVSMVKKQFRWKLLVKCQEETSLIAFVLYCIKKLKENDPLKGLTIHLTNTFSE